MKRIIIEIGHPAHVHQFKNLYWELSLTGSSILFVVKDKECVIDLMEYYALPYKVLGVNHSGILRKIISLPALTIKLLSISMRFKPDLFISRVSPFSGYVSYIMKKPHITFTDTENVKLLDSISEPFADVVLTSTSYSRDHGQKQLRYPGYHELAYLHPNRFTPNVSIYSALGLAHGDCYAIVRFVSWTAHHDVGHKGMSSHNKVRLVSELSKHLKVFISSESILPAELEKFRIKIKPSQMHDALSCASLFVGESATMASESAILGTPAIYINDNHYGCIDDQAQYGLLFTMPESQDGQIQAIEKAVMIASQCNLDNNYGDIRNKLLSEKIDVTAFMTWFVDNYPGSREEMKDSSFNFSNFC